MTKFKIASFGFRSVPLQKGCTGSDKFAEELLVRLAKKGYQVNAYNRIYKNSTIFEDSYKGINLYNLKTVEKKGFDTLLHSLKTTIHIIMHNTGNVVHIHNGGNSIWALFLRLFGKKVLVTQDGTDWHREDWSWYGKLYLRISAFITARIPNEVIFDNIYTKEIFENKYRKKFNFIPYGSEIVENTGKNSNILKKLNLKPKEYFLFVGRFIPDKGLQYLIPAFEKIKTDKKLVLVGGSLNKSEFEQNIRSTKDERIIFPGYIYGNDTNCLIKNAYAYIQPSDIEGLSPVILSVMGLQTPIICSDIKENIYIVENTALTFGKANVRDLTDKIVFSLTNENTMRTNATKAKKHVDEKFNWDVVVNQYVDLF